MDYSYLISNMTWSYSRLKFFEMCPYGFFIKYIKPMPSTNQFFSDYGKFIHKILELMLIGILSKNDAVVYYVSSFQGEVKGRPPNIKIFNSYFQQGFEYLRNFSFPYSDILRTEFSTEFLIDNYNFIGIVDCVIRDKDDLVIVDHKSRNLKPISKRAKPTQNDIEIETMVRQLYLYSIPIKTKYGIYPSRLEFNCFRNGNLVSVNFNIDKLEDTKQWVKETIGKIETNSDWSPRPEFWKCKYICDMRDSCEYCERK